jgi:hypothetical protein
MMGQGTSNPKDREFGHYEIWFNDEQKYNSWERDLLELASDEAKDKIRGHVILDSGKVKGSLRINALSQAEVGNVLDFRWRAERRSWPYHKHDGEGPREWLGETRRAVSWNFQDGEELRVRSMSAVM